MIWPLLAILTLILLLLLAAPLLKDGTYSKPFISLFFIGFLALSLGTYALIGRPDLLKEGMTTEQRAEMILAMVDSLATRLEDNPQDEQGWTRLIRARAVLGQDEKLAADKARLKEIFKDNPDIIERILAAAN